MSEKKKAQHPTQSAMAPPLPLWEQKLGGWSWGNFVMRLFALIMLAYLMSACSSIAPPSIPAQLDNTPGAFVRVTGRYYENDTFRVNSLDGWRVQTSPATSAPYVLFIAPDESALIIFATDTLDPLPQPDINPDRLSSDIRTVSLDNGVEVFTALIAPTDDFDERLALYEFSLSTLTATE